MSERIENSALNSWSKYIRLLAKIVLCIYLFILIYLTLFGDHYRFPELRLNLIPFKAIQSVLHAYQMNYDTDVRNTIRNLYGNILLYLPLGFLLPFAFRSLNRFVRVLCAALILSTAFEFLQALIYLGTSDIDDIILNAIGACLGYGISCLVRQFLCSKLSAHTKLS